jgi:hypothetical protein
LAFALLRRRLFSFLFKGLLVKGESPYVSFSFVTA